MAISSGAEGDLCDCSAPSNHECVYRENIVGGRPQAPSRLQRQKLPQKSPNDDLTASSLGEVVAS